MYEIEYTPEAYDEIHCLTDAVLDEVLDYIKKYKTEPFKYSIKLHNQGKLNLEGCRKTYVAKATYSIVIKIENKIAKIVEVIVVGKRENKEVYQNAHKRISQQ